MCESNSCQYMYHLNEVGCQTQDNKMYSECFLCGLKFRHESELLAHLQIIQHRMNNSGTQAVYLQCYRCKQCWDCLKRFPEAINHQCLLQRVMYLKMFMCQMNEICHENPYMCLCCASDKVTNDQCCGPHMPTPAKFSSPLELAVHVIGKHNPNRVKNQCGLCQEFMFDGKEIKYPELQRWSCYCSNMHNSDILPQLCAPNQVCSTLDSHIKRNHVRFYEMLYILSRWKYKDVSPYEIYGCILCKMLELFNSKSCDEDDCDAACKNTPSLQTHMVMTHTYGGAFSFLKLTCQICSQEIHFSKNLGDQRILPPCKREHIRVLVNAQQQYVRSGIIPHTYIFDWETICLFCLKNFNKHKGKSDKGCKGLERLERTCALQVHIMIEHNLEVTQQTCPNLQANTGTLFQYIEPCGICGKTYMDLITEARKAGRRLEHVLIDLHKELMRHENMHVKQVVARYNNCKHRPSKPRESLFVRNCHHKPCSIKDC